MRLWKLGVWWREVVGGVLAIGRLHSLVITHGLLQMTTRTWVLWFTTQIFSAPVSSLFNVQGMGWDVECVRDIFNARDATIILNIPITLRKP